MLPSVATLVFFFFFFLLPQLLEYYTLLATTVVIHDGESQDWRSSKPYFEGERISAAVQFWGFHMQGLRCALHPNFPHPNSYFGSFNKSEKYYKANPFLFFSPPKVETSCKATGGLLIPYAEKVTINSSFSPTGVTCTTSSPRPWPGGSCRGSSASHWAASPSGTRR